MTVRDYEQGVLWCGKGIKETLREENGDKSYCEKSYKAAIKKPANHQINGLHNLGISKKSSGTNYDSSQIQKF